jgi:hypothetical protein
MVELSDDRLRFSFPEVHRSAVLSVDFQRTLRIPDDNRDYPLPPGLEKFPMAHVEDHASKLPPDWVRRGGVLLPMYQSEALWINFSATFDYPFAVKIAAGKINAATGDAWTNDLSHTQQDYLVVPTQPWLDGFCVQKGLVRQFVAMPLGEGYTAEEQLSSAADHGGIQIIVYPMKKSVYEQLERKIPSLDFCDDFDDSVLPECGKMGLAPGGLMRQEIYDDPYGINAWGGDHSRCFVHILNSAQWKACTGGAPPSRAITATDYADAGLPWFEYYSDSSALEGSKKLASLDSVGAVSIKQGKPPLQDNEAVTPKKIVAIKNNSVTDGNW